MRWKNFAFLQSSSYQQHIETHAYLTKMATYDAKVFSYIHLHNECNVDMVLHSMLSQSDSETDLSADDKTDFFNLMIVCHPAASTVQSDAEFTMYENEREIGRKKNPLERWRLNRSKYSWLAKMAYRYL